MIKPLAALAAALLYIGLVLAFERWRDVRDVRRAARAAATAPPSWWECPDCVTGDHGRVDCDEHAAEFALAVAAMSGGSGPLARTCVHSFEDAPSGVVGCTCEVSL